MSRNLEHEGQELSRIHAQSNYRKAMGYWLGFLKGVLASDNVEAAEFEPLRVEAENFLRLLRDPDAFELIEDLRIWRDQPGEIYAIIEDIVGMRSREFQIETEADEVNDFYGFCAGIAADNRITPAEVERLLARLDAYPRLSSSSRVVNLRNAARLAIADGRVTEEESDDICEWITRLVGDSATDTGLPTFGNAPAIDGALTDHAEVIFDGRMFVLTGKFLLGPRKSIEAMIADRGGASKASVCKKTHYLGIATEASRDWKHSHEGLKIIKAMELRDSGQGPHLVMEGTLSQALGRV